MNSEKVVKTSQEQAVAAWIDYLNRLRCSRLAEAVSQIEENFAKAVTTLDGALGTIHDDIIAKNRGNSKGMHGFIAEVAECGIGNARREVTGLPGEYIWINDNGVVDFMRGGTAIQQKFSACKNHLSLAAVKMHLDLYPDFLKNGGKYQIPSDHYEQIKYLLSVPKDVANKMPTSNGEFSLSQWKFVHDFFKTNEIGMEDLEPSLLDYRSVQKNNIDYTFEQERLSIADTRRKRIDTAQSTYRPSVAEGAKATAAGAAAEGCIAFCVGIVKKTSTGKKLKDFNESDWKEICGDAGVSTVKGGVRGASIYALTNFAATPAAAANAMVTATFGIADQISQYRNNTVQLNQLIENSEVICLEATISAVSSVVGQAIIPIPVLGAIVGNATGMMLYQLSKMGLDMEEERLIGESVRNMECLSAEMDDEYKDYIISLNASMGTYFELLSQAFVGDISECFEGSVRLAKSVGVSSNKILDSLDKIDYFFLD